jgi:hypothetical protein
MANYELADKEHALDRGVPPLPRTNEASEERRVMLFVKNAKKCARSIKKRLEADPKRLARKSVP